MTGGPGRPGKVLVGNNGLVSLGVDIGVSEIRLLGLGLGGQELGQKRIDLDVPSLPPDEVFCLVGEELNGVVRSDLIHPTGDDFADTFSL